MYPSRCICLSLCVHLGPDLCPCLFLSLSLSLLCMHVYMYVLVVLFVSLHAAIVCIAVIHLCSCNCSFYVPFIFDQADHHFSIATYPDERPLESLSIPKDVRCTKQQCILLYADNKAHGL